MSRYLVALTLVLWILPVSAQDQEKTVTTPKPTEPTVQQPEAEPTAAPNKKQSTVKRKIDQAIPDCVNLIFYHGCRHSTARQEEAQKKADEQRAEAAERCRQLEAARPKSVANTAPASLSPEVPAGESSSRTSLPDLSGPYCTAETVLSAEHDVEVGDFNMENKNYKGAEMRYRSALQTLPGDPIATLHLARLLEKTGRYAEALEQYKAFMEWSPTGKQAEEAKAAIAKLQNKG